MDIGPGCRLGNLLVEREIGRGAFGRVYLAHDTLLKRNVALKVIAHGGDRERVVGEARHVAALRSAHVVTLYGVHSLGEDWWAFELEYVDGGSLEALLGNPPTQERAVGIMRDVASGLKAAHDAGIIHGDVKPGNVLLDRNGLAKIADFGLALPLVEHSSSRGELVGTPRYMAPEVVMGARPSRASDIWSFGVLVCELVGGRYPFPKGNIQALFQAVVNGDPLPFARAVPERIERLALRCLRKSPSERPKSCDVLLEELSADRVTARPREPLRAAAAAPYGREGELARLSALLERAEQGSASGLLISGEAGIGKSTLLGAARAEAARLGFMCVDTSVSRLQGFVRPLLRALQERDSSAMDEPERSREEVVRDVDRRLGDLLEARPLALFIEEAQECSPQDAREIRSLPLRFAKSRFFFAATYRLHSDSDSDRRDHVAVWPHDIASHPQLEHEPLGPLRTDAILALLEAEERGARLGGLVAQRVTSLAEGNPLFAKELLRHLREQDAVIERDREIVPGPRLGLTSMPRRIRDLVARRLGGLTADERAILDVAAVDGLEFDGRAIAAVLDRPVLWVLRALQQLYRGRGLVTPHPQGYRFAHATIHEAILSEVAPELRRELHARLAGHLEGRSGVDPQRLGHHYLRAGDLERARPYLLEAACAAERRQEISRTIELCESVGLLADRIDLDTAPRDQAALFALAGCYHDSGRHAEAESVYDALARAAQAAGDGDLLLRIAVRRAKATFLWRGRGHVDEDALRRAAGALPPSHDLGSACYVLGLCAKYDGRLDQAEACFGRAGEVFDAVGNEGGRSDVRDQLGSIALRRGQFEEAQRHYAEAARLSAAIGRRLNAAISEVNRSLVAFNRGDLEGLADSLATSIRSLRLEGSADSAAHAEVLLGQVKFAEGHLPAARELVTHAREALERSNFLPALLGTYLVAAELALVADDVDAALAFIDRAEGVGRQGHRSGLAGALALRALGLTLAGRETEAQGAARASLVVVRDLADRGARAEALGHLAQAVLFGLPPAVLDEAPNDHASPHVAALLEAARISRTGAPSGALERVATALLRALPGPRRALCRALALWLRAAAISATPRESGANDAVDAALASARALGHVPLQRCVERLLARSPPTR